MSALMPKCIGYALTHSLTNSRLLNFMDVSLACEDANLKFVEVVTFVDVSDEDRVGRFGSRGLVIKFNFCLDFEHFGQNFEVEVQARF